MPEVIGVRFKEAAKIYYFSPQDVGDIEVGSHVVVETARGLELGQVVLGRHEVSDAEVAGELKPVVRRATNEDLISREYYRMREGAAVARCRQKVLEHHLPMKIVGAEYSFDGSSLVFFFTAEKRVDFRDLVRDLARLFRARIELRQIGVRDEAKLIGGIGPCGRRLCCITHLTEFMPVSIKMAKQQDLPLSPMEISGLCGRLLCCLAYENDFYEEARSKMPKPGEIIDTPYGKAKVLSPNVIKQSVMIELESGVTTEMAWSPEGVTPVIAAAERPAPEEPVKIEDPEEVPPPALEPAPRPSSKSRRRRRRRSASGGRASQGSEKR